nr:hypothetical protein CFP56_09833 [Quercus suber]POF12684.1 hypothetical protein CFP56_09836 [Quercus suber]
MQAETFVCRDLLQIFYSLAASLFCCSFSFSTSCLPPYPAGPGAIMLDARSSFLAHAIQDLTLVLLSFFFLPLSTAILFSSYAVNIVYTAPPVQNRKHVRGTHTPYFEPRTILVTGVGMTKGLALARIFYSAGHNVIGADFQSFASGRMSKALKSYHTMPKPDGTQQGRERYVEAMIDLIAKESVDMWVSCSGVASAAEDGMLADKVRDLTGCEAVQFDLRTTQQLHEKHSFMEYTRSLGLRIPRTHTVTSQASALAPLHEVDDKGRKYIMKFIGTDDSVRGDMTLLPLDTLQATKAHIQKLEISESRPWILQQYIQGPEFCTHALVVRGEVKAFVACPSSELLMHYEALPTDSSLSRSMLRFTQEFAAAGGQNFTGHLSFDFLIEQEDADRAKHDPSRNVKLYPIECNPRVHTAVVLFQDTPELVKAYLSVLEPNYAKSPAAINHAAHDPIFVKGSRRYYWIGHDLLELLILPILTFVFRRGSTVAEIYQNLRTFVDHLLFWSEGTFEIWDPLPAWMLYHVYWPLMFAHALVGRWKWSRVNVSTCKIFRCD